MYPGCHPASGHTNPPTPSTALNLFGPADANRFMNTLYRKAVCVPSLVFMLLLSACDSEPPPRHAAAPVSNRYLEALQEAEAAKQSAEQHNLEQQRIDELLGRGQLPAR